MNKFLLASAGWYLSAALNPDEAASILRNHVKSYGEGLEIGSLCKSYSVRKIEFEGYPEIY